MTLTFCTYFDSVFLDRGTALIESGLHWNPGSEWHVLCLDEAVGGILRERFGSKVHLVAIADLEKKYPALAACKPSRSHWEYCLTCRCHFVEYLLNGGIESIVCLDGDFYFFDRLDGLFDKETEVVITPHRFPSRLDILLRYGKFNAGFTAFKKGDSSKKILREWCESCLEHCDSVGDAEHYTDQKYLDAWEGMPGVRVLTCPTVNSAPWNLGNHPVERRDGRPHVNGQPLCLFHFHGLREFYPGCWISGLGAYGNELTGPAREDVYLPYLRHILRVRENKETVAEPLLLPSDAPPDAPPTQHVAVGFANEYEKNLRLLHEKENVIQELDEACRERLKKIVELRETLARTERTSVAYWINRMLRLFTGG